MKKARVVIAILVTGFGLLQFFGPEEPAHTQMNDLAGLPGEINSIIRNSCFDCHSTQTNLRWYDKLTPVNYLVYDHVLDGRKALDFSKWDSLTPQARNGILYYSLNKILQGEMPLASYTAVHPGAKLTDKDIQALKSFLLTRTSRKPADSTQINEINQQFSDFIKGRTALSKQSVRPSPNGIEYIPDYRNWKAVSISDRFDNGTMRIIYANDVAVKAIGEHKTNPWPDDAIFAKAAWKQKLNPDGRISTGQFSQVEFMIKDSRKYSSTKGWGWARWRGSDLKPYGGTALFTTECISCHKPMKDNDYIFTKPLYLK
jgi:hypothetical protein